MCCLPKVVLEHAVTAPEGFDLESYKESLCWSTHIGMVSLRVLDFSISLSIWYAFAFSSFSRAQSHWFAPTTPTPKHPRTPIDTHIMCGFPSLHGMIPVFFS